MYKPHLQALETMIAELKSRVPVDLYRVARETISDLEQMYPDIVTASGYEHGLLELQLLPLVDPQTRGELLEPKSSFLCSDNKNQ